MNDPHKQRAFLYTLVGLGLGLFVVGAIYLGISTHSLVGAVRDTQLDRTQITEDTAAAAERAKEAAENAARSAERIEDCTTPGRKCFDDSQKRTAEAIVGINEGTLRVIVAAISCQDDGITEQRALSICTVRRAESKYNRP